MSNPAVTVLMPVYNGAAFLRESIASVLNQRFCDFELLAIDDGSTDESAAIFSSFADPRIRLLRHEQNQGLVATLNHGLAESRGEWIARQDADDLSAPGRLAAQMAFLRGNPAVPLLGCDAWLIDQRGGGCGRWRTGGHADLVAWDLCFRAPFAHGSAVFRRSVVRDRLGGYRDFPACEDLDLWARVAEEFPVVTLRDPLVKYRLHDSSIMAGAAGNQNRMAAVKTVLMRHLAAVAPGLAIEDRERIAAVWSGVDPAEWGGYFEAIKALELGFSRGRRKPAGFGRLMAEQHYTIFYRVSRIDGGRCFLKALSQADPGGMFRLPWARMLVAMLRR